MSPRRPLPAVDERLVAPESRAEIIDGQLIRTMGSNQPHGTRHFDAAGLFFGLLADGYSGAVDMLTRADEDTDAAPDVSVFPSAPDPATGGAPWTACYGHTGPDVKPGATYTKAECDALLDADMAAADATVRRCIPVPMLRHVEGALVSLVFNVGPRAVCGSTIQKYALANNWPAACDAIEAWKDTHRH